MTEPHRTFDQQQHVEAHAPYLKVFFALLVLTILEYCYAKFLPIGFYTLVVGLMALAIIKATLVGMYFMHLKFEGRWVYIMLIPAGILMLVLTFGLIPDIGMGHGADELYPEDDELTAAPREPGPPMMTARS